MERYVVQEVAARHDVRSEVYVRRDVQQGYHAGGVRYSCRWSVYGRCTAALAVVVRRLSVSAPVGVRRCTAGRCTTVYSRCTAGLYSRSVYHVGVQQVCTAGRCTTVYGRVCTAGIGCTTVYGRSVRQVCTAGVRRRTASGPGRLSYTFGTCRWVSGWPRLAVVCSPSADGRGYHSQLCQPMTPPPPAQTVFGRRLGQTPACLYRAVR